MRSVCVFCGSQSGADPAHAATARLLGRELAARGLALVYGGGRVGLMGEVAAACVRAGGRVVGVIPNALSTKEVAFADATELIVVGSMHERKALMADRADAFVALPGGFGTCDELFEILTWRSSASTPSRWRCSTPAGSSTRCWPGPTTWSGTGS